MADQSPILKLEGDIEPVVGNRVFLISPVREADVLRAPPACHIVAVGTVESVSPLMCSFAMDEADCLFNAYIDPDTKQMTKIVDYTYFSDPRSKHPFKEDKLHRLKVIFPPKEVWSNLSKLHGQEITECKLKPITDLVHIIDAGLASDATKEEEYMADMAVFAVSYFLPRMRVIKAYYFIKYISNRCTPEEFALISKSFKGEFDSLMESRGK